MFNNHAEAVASSLLLSPSPPTVGAASQHTPHQLNQCRWQMYLGQEELWRINARKDHTTADDHNSKF